MRKNTLQINAGGLLIGGGAPISIQSMTNVPATDVEASLAQINALYDAGCDLVRLAVPDMDSARAFALIRQRSPLPLSADIHFDYRLALAAVEAGADKIRINPGNIGSEDRIRAVAEACGKAGVPIRVGVNSGSVRRDILEKCGGPTTEALLLCAEENIKALEKYGFRDICLSIKASDVSRTIEANLAASKAFPYPLHIGVTEAGAGEAGRLRSGIGIGALLAMGVGDTVRVSLTGDPVKEIYAAKDILAAVGMNKSGVNVVSCPTCGRTKVCLEEVAAEVSAAVKTLKTDKKLTVAVMGCIVNGPGEAREADVGLAGGVDEFLLFVKGEPVRKVPADHAVAALLDELRPML